MFAPTDAAFAKLPAGSIASVKPENKEKLKAILLYRVASGKVTAADVMKLNGQSATLTFPAVTVCAYASCESIVNRMMMSQEKRCRFSRPGQ